MSDSSVGNPLEKPSSSNPKGTPQIPKPKTLSVNQMKVWGETRIKTVGIVCIAFFCLAILGSGLAYTITSTDHKLELWAVFAPLLTVGVTGIVTIITGKKDSE